jgi:(p)ppGpp synthase/HD superfamily hydrolase
MRKSLLETVIDIAVLYHRNQTDKGNPDIPYVLHPLSVASSLADEGESKETVAVALLHDVIEDSLLTLEGLKAYSIIPNLVIDAVDAITRREGETYNEYLARVKSNPMATKVKLKDLKHNMNPDRLARVEGGKSRLQKRYTSAYKYLTQKEME